MLRRVESEDVVEEKEVTAVSSFADWPMWEAESKSADNLVVGWSTAETEPDSKLEFQRIHKVVRTAPTSQ